MKAAAGRPQSIGRTTMAGTPPPVEPGPPSFASSLGVSLLLHGLLVVWLLASAWLMHRAQPYRLAAQTVYLAGDSPLSIDQVPGEGGGVSGAKQEGKETGGGGRPAQTEGSAIPSVEKFAPPVEKPTATPSKVVPEKAMHAPAPKPVVEKAAPPPPKPVVEKPELPAPVPKPVVEKAIPAPPKPPPDAMTLAQKQKELKPTPPAVPTPPKTPEARQKPVEPTKRPSPPENPEAKMETERQQRVAQLRERQAQQEAQQERAEQAFRQRMGSLRAEQADKQALGQSMAALRSRVGSGGGSGEGTGPGEGPGTSGGTGTSGSGPGSGTAGSGKGGGAPGGGRGTGIAGAGGVGTGGLSGIRLRNYQGELQAKITNAWNIPPQSKGLEAAFFLVISRAGHVEQARLVRGSGNALFDESLQRAIRQAQPLPALPEDYTDRTLVVTLNFRGRG